MMHWPQCCYLADDGVQCQNRAEYWTGKNEVCEYTHACADHLDALREDGDRVYPIDQIPDGEPKSARRPILN